MGYAYAMGKIAFLVGAVGTLVVGLLLSGKLVRRDYTCSVMAKSGGHSTCPTLWVSWVSPPDVVPEGLVKCGCPEQAANEQGGTPIHPAQQVYDVAANMDLLVLSYTEFTTPGGDRKIGLSWDVRRGTNKETYVISPASDAYMSFAGYTAAPLILGIIVGVLLGLLPKKKTAAD